MAVPPSKSVVVVDPSGWISLRRIPNSIIVYAPVKFEQTRYQSDRDRASARESYDNDEVGCTNFDIFFIIPLTTNIFAAVADRRIDDLVTRDVVKGTAFKMEAGI